MKVFSPEKAVLWSQAEPRERSKSHIINETRLSFTTSSQRFLWDLRRQSCESISQQFQWDAKLEKSQWIIKSVVKLSTKTLRSFHNYSWMKRKVIILSRFVKNYFCFLLVNLQLRFSVNWTRTDVYHHGYHVPDNYRYSTVWIIRT